MGLGRLRLCTSSLLVHWVWSQLTGAYPNGEVPFHSLLPVQTLVQMHKDFLRIAALHAPLRAQALLSYELVAKIALAAFFAHDFPPATPIMFGFRRVVWLGPWCLSVLGCVAWLRRLSTAHPICSCYCLHVFSSSRAPARILPRRPSHTHCNVRSTREGSGFATFTSQRNRTKFLCCLYKHLFRCTKHFFQCSCCLHTRCELKVY